MKIPKALNQGGYTYEFEGLYLTPQAARAQFSWKKRTELCEDSRYRIKHIKGIPDPSFALYIWY